MLGAAGYLKRVGRVVVRGLRHRDGAAPREPARLAVERRDLHVSPKRLRAYLSATQAPEFLAPGANLPPLYQAVWEAAMALEMLGDPGAPVVRGGVVHLESELLVVRPLQATDSVRCRLELEGAEPHPRGTLLRLVCRTWNEVGQLCSEGRTSLLVRGGTGRAPLREERPPRAEGEWPEIARWRLRANLGRRYAAASGDYNPIHLWRLTALPFGFRRPILHGFCTAALAAHALIGRFFDADVTALRRFRIGFRRPLLLPATVRLLASADSAVAVRFRVVGEDDRIHAEGEASGRTGPL